MAEKFLLQLTRELCRSMPFISVPDGWTCKLEATSKQVSYSFIHDDSRKEKSISVVIKVDDEKDLIHAEITYCGIRIKPQLELYMEGMGTDKDFPGLGATELYYIVMMKFRTFFHHEGMHELEDFLMSCLQDFCIRDSIPELADSSSPGMTLDLPEGF